MKKITVLNPFSLPIHLLLVLLSELSDTTRKFPHFTVCHWKLQYSRTVPGMYESLNIIFVKSTSEGMKMLMYLVL